MPGQPDEAPLPEKSFMIHLDAVLRMFRPDFIKAELKRADLTYEELAERPKEHGLEETRYSITAKLQRGTFPATFLLAVMAAIGRRSVSLAEV